MTNVSMHGLNPDLASLFESAKALHNARNLDAARAAYIKVLDVQPNHAESLHNLGIIFMQQGDLFSAAVYMQRAVGVDLSQPAYFSNYGNILQDLGLWADAIVQFQKAIALNPSFADAHYNLGNAFTKVNNLPAAIESYHRAIALRPEWALAYVNCGNAHDLLGQYEDALRNFEKAIELAPDFSGVYLNRANVLNKMGRGQDAMVAYNIAADVDSRVYQQHLERADLFLSQERLVEALQECEVAIKQKPQDHLPYFLAGTIYYRMRNIPLSVENFRRSIEINPANFLAYNGLGMAFAKAYAYDDAIKSFSKALELNPKMDLARINLADTYFSQGNLQAALDNFQLLDPGLQPLGLMQFFKLQLGDWSNYEADRENFLNRLPNKRLMGITEDPWHMFRMTDSPALAKQVAKSFYETAFRREAALPPIKRRAPGKKIKVGYYSPDFRDHAVAHLSLEMLESRDRDNFETYAFAFGPANIDDAMRPRLVKAFDHFIEIDGKNDVAAAKLARDIELDIAIDLSGITSGARPDLFKNRAAPIQINYLGFTGTLGTDCHDYIIGDPVVIPLGAAEHYTEKVVHLPCMMPYDTRHQVSGKAPTRAEAGLPETGFIFCSFNQGFKFTPAIFDSWMRILNKTPGSYLWMSSQRGNAADNLRNEAAKRGVDPSRIIFAPRIKDIDDHLARVQLGDLFLDTFPYNAHTSAIDSLWAGVPVITRMGDSFASRLAGSLVTTLGLTELIVPSVEAYEALAVELALNPKKLQAVRAKLNDKIKTSSLFNIKLYTKNFESALRAMYDRWHSGMEPDFIAIKN